MTLVEQAAKFISVFEGLRLTPYQNPNDRPTIGYGCTFYENGTAVTLNDPAITQQRAEQLLEYFVQKSLDKVDRFVTTPLTDSQIIALADFEYNTGALYGSTLLSYVNANDMENAAGQFPRWVHAGGVVLKALVERREKERELFVS